MRTFYKVLVTLLIVIILGYVLVNISYENHLNKNQIPIPPVPDKERYVLKLYFGSSQNDGLAVEKRVIISSEQIEEVLILEELIKGPRNKMLNMLMPQYTKIISVKTVEGICYINFSREILNVAWGEMNKEMMIWSIVNSITELDYIQGVQILVEGNKEGFEPIYSIKDPLFRNEKFIKKEMNMPMNTFSQFISYLINDNYKKSYEMLDKYSKEKYDFVKFKLTIGNYAQEMKNYEIHMYQTQKYEQEVVLVINFRKKKDVLTDLEDEMIEKWKLIYEDGAWKIVLPI
ncbi:GerMN domain-containing protein [Crassaminicella profunda]|uniref:GerMN domain-containing protein n=1 Tax=Crassaminicella profunda TaxID=1286698 RepID=UPI001CA6A40A|nr:GerMN domain-containing protein [Crassaminicella profunda]QZY57066.1 GerMN domain-containing protein [Crassaminicella profunda]